MAHRVAAGIGRSSAEFQPDELPEAAWKRVLNDVAEAIEEAVRDAGL